MSRFAPTLLPFSLVFALACGGPAPGAREAHRELARGNFELAAQKATQTLEHHPRDPTAWRVRIRATMGQGDFSGAAALYAQWRELRGSHDREAYRLMSKTALWQGLRVPSAPTVSETIRIIADHELESFAEDVRDKLGDDSDLVAAAASIALLRSHPAAPQIATELLQSDDESARLLVVKGIARKIGKRAAQDLLGMVDDSSLKVRRAAINAVASWKRDEDKALLTRLVREDEDGQIRSRALRGLLATGGSELVDLASSLLKDDYLGVRLAAVAILDRKGGDDIDGLLRELTASEDLSLALRAASALYRRSTESQLAVVERAYASQVWSDRAAALNALASCAPRRQAIDFAARAMADHRIEVRLAAARMLLSMDVEAPAMNALEEALQSDRRDARLHAATDLARRGHDAAAEVLGKLAATGSIDERLAAIHAHRSAGTVSQGLIDALGSDNIELRLAAADTLLGL